MSSIEQVVETRDTCGNITAIANCTLEVSHLPDHSGPNSDYWQAWVNGVQDDGLTRNEAIRNAHNRFSKQ